MALTPLDKLRLFLRPPGKGLATFSTGGGYAKPLHRKLYGTDDPSKIQSYWEDTLQKIRLVDQVLIGVPSDIGAGILRGASFGPMGIREAYLQRYGAYPKNLIDIGDIICVPQLLHDEMLNEAQIKATSLALYPDVEPGLLPVSALSVAEAAMKLIHDLNPKARLISMGGDHSCSWPAIKFCEHRYKQDFAVLHFDAHSDLMDYRMGVKYCFATWAHHAVKLMKPEHMVQVGIRTSARTKEQWVRELPVVQFWAPEIRGKENETIEAVVNHFKKIKAKGIFISNDIDGTDSAFAPATGTPEAHGLNPNFIKKLLDRMNKDFNVFGGDIVEVAPPLSGSLDFTSEKTCLVAADYLHSMIHSN